MPPGWARSHRIGDVRAAFSFLESAGIGSQPGDTATSQVRGWTGGPDTVAQLKTTHVCLRGWQRWDKGLPEDPGSKGGKLLPVGTATPIPVLLASSNASARALKGHFLEKDQEEDWSPRQHTQSV